MSHTTIINRAKVFFENNATQKQRIIQKLGMTDVRLIAHFKEKHLANFPDVTQNDFEKNAIVGFLQAAAEGEHHETH